MSRHIPLDIAEGFVRPNLPDAVARHLREVILRPDFGANLPSERELTVLFGVSRPVIRLALDRLEEERLIHRRHGTRTRVLRAAPRP